MVEVKNTGTASGSITQFPDDEAWAVPMRGRLYSQSLSCTTLKNMEEGNTLSTLYDRLQQCINMSLDCSGR